MTLRRKRWENAKHSRLYQIMPDLIRRKKYTDNKKCQNNRGNKHTYWRFNILFCNRFPSIRSEKRFKYDDHRIYKCKHTGDPCNDWKEYAPCLLRENRQLFYRQSRRKKHLFTLKTIKWWQASHGKTTHQSNDKRYEHKLNYSTQSADSPRANL